MQAPQITSITFDKSLYLPGDTATVRVGYVSGMSDTVYPIHVAGSGPGKSTVLDGAFTVVDDVTDASSLVALDSLGQAWVQQTDDGLTVRFAGQVSASAELAVTILDVGTGEAVTMTASFSVQAPIAKIVGAETSTQASSTANGKTAADFAWAETVLGPLGSSRYFYSGALPADFAQANGSDLPPGAVPIYSYKTQNTNVRSFCRSVSRPIVLIFHHEPEGDFANGAAFVSQFQAQSDLIRSAGNPLIRVAMCAAGFPYRNGGTAEVLAGNYLKGLGDYVDLFTKDVYADSSAANTWSSQGLANYPVFQNWLKLVTDPSVVGTVRPLGITEYGIGGTALNAVRNARLQQDIAYLRSEFPAGLELFEYWWLNEAPMAASTMYQFTDSPTIQTFQQIASGRI